MLSGGGLVVCGRGGVVLWWCGMLRKCGLHTSWSQHTLPGPELDVAVAVHALQPSVPWVAGGGAPCGGVRRRPSGGPRCPQTRHRSSRARSARSCRGLGRKTCVWVLGRQLRGERRCHGRVGDESVGLLRAAIRPIGCLGFLAGAAVPFEFPLVCKLYTAR